jgi:hypothetical protein
MRAPGNRPQEKGTWVVSHRYQQRTPAMALHLTDHQWSWQEFLLYRVRVSVHGLSSSKNALQVSRRYALDAQETIGYH